MCIRDSAYCDRSMTRDYDREALNAFFATLKEEDFEVVVVRSLNEITDDIYDVEEFVKTITDMGIWLYSCLLYTASISHAVGVLKNGGFLTMDDDGFLHLTVIGREIAEKIYERHLFFMEQFLSLIHI